MKHVLITIIFLMAFLSLATKTPCAEPSLEQAIELFHAGKTTETLHAVQVYLQALPNEPRGLFLHGLALERLGRVAEAMDVYQTLISTHPEFPEPYNNLAGLLASQGRFEEAKETLQQALQTHPSYAAAHQNLSKIYSAMASQAYRRVLGAEEDSLQVSLEPLEELSVLGGQGLLADAAMPMAASVAQPSKPRTEPDAPSAQKPHAVAPPAESPGDPTSALDTAEEPLETEDSAPPEAASQTPVVELQSAQPESPEFTEPQGLYLQQQMKSVLQEWAKAWASQNVQAYLSFYSSLFVPEGGLSLKRWQDQRKARVAAPPFIRISLSDITVSELDQGVVQVHFSQHYKSNVINDQVRKELLFTKDNGQWRITRERLLPR